LLAAWCVTLWLPFPALAQTPFRNTVNVPFHSRCNGPQGAIVVRHQRGVVQPAALGQSVYAQHSPAKLRQAAASFARLQRQGLKSRRGEVRFPRTVVHTLGDQLIQPDLLRTQQGGGLGDPTNTLTFTFEGWNAGDRTALQNYLQGALPKARLVYGPPAFNLNVKIIQDNTMQAIQGGTYDTATNEIRLPPLSGNFPEDTYVLLMLVLNAFHDDTSLFYDAWEQGFIGAAAYVIQSTPGVSPGYDPIDPGPFYCLSVYEPENQPELGNSTYYPASGATNMLIWRIAMARAAWLKCYIENPNFFAEFNQRYYAAFTPDLPGDVPALKELAAQVVPTVEGFPFAEWFGRQHVLDTSVRLGPKLYTWNIPLPDAVALICELYETLPNGDERPFGGVIQTRYWNHEFNIQLYAEEGNVINIPPGGTTPGEGFLLPTFFNIGGPTRITVEMNVAGLRREYPFPYGQRGFELGENNLYGVIIGANVGTIDVQGGRGLSGLAVNRGAWGGRITSAQLQPTPITVTFTNAFGQVMQRQFNIGWDSYCCFLDGGRQYQQSHTFNYDLSGLHLMSVPLIPTQTNPAQVLGIAAERLLLAWWDPLRGGDNKYLIWPAFPFRNPGYGYWLRVLQDTTVTVQGAQTDQLQPHQVPLAAGWNLVGSPRLNNVPLTALTVQAGDAAAVSWAEAVTARLVQDGLYGYGQTTGYELKTALEPWAGYWIRCLEPSGVRLIFPGGQQTPQTAATAGTAAVAETLDWKLPLVVEAGPLRSATAYLGTARQAAEGLDRHDLLAPPSFGQYVEARFVKSNWGTASGRYVSDVRPSAARSPRWDFEVRCSLPDTEVRLTWPGLANLPSTVKPILSDPASGQRLYLRTATEYRFRSGAQGGVRTLSIELPPAESLLTLTALTARQTAQGVALSYTLSTAASASVRIINLAGREVRRLQQQVPQAAGQQTALWDLRGNLGTAVPPGIYLVEVSARADSGQAVRGLQTVRVQR
jgi:hypothetical protein